jgi:carboxyl-terminal processing protease
MQIHWKEIAVAALVVPLLSIPAQGQEITKIQRGEVQSMLRQISPDVEKHYYDPKFHGENWDALTAQAMQKIDTTNSLPHAMAAVAGAMMPLDDSHTFFIPPAYSTRFKKGWQLQMIGDRCFIVQVKPGSDADKQGVKPGDEVLAINGFVPERQSLWKLQYAFNLLSPRVVTILALRNPSGQQREIPVKAAEIHEQDIIDLTSDGGDANYWNLVLQEQNEWDLTKARFNMVGTDVGVLKLPSFMCSRSDIDRMLSKARKARALVIDLRGNPGGSTDTLQYMLGDFFPAEVKIGNRVGRKEHKPMIAKPQPHPFEGKVIVLIDSKSASAAELFSRVMQLEKRATIVGDASSGKVMEAKIYRYHSGTDTRLFFGAEITDADIVMSDGKSLEKHGVTPDELLLPTADDLAAGRDPVLAHAVELAGGKITPEAAGKLFPYEWPKS